MLESKPYKGEVHIIINIGKQNIYAKREGMKERYLNWKLAIDRWPTF